VCVASVCRAQCVVAHLPLAPVGESPEIQAFDRSGSDPKFRPDERRDRGVKLGVSLGSELNKCTFEDTIVGVAYSCLNGGLGPATRIARD